MKLTKAQKRELKKQAKLKRQIKKNELLVQEIRYEMAQDRETRPEIHAKTEAQSHYIIAIKQSQLTFGIGPAGTGKTYICSALAAEALELGLTHRIVVTRPAVESGESLGFLPGELDDKFEPFLRPFMDVFEDWFGRKYAESLINMGRIEVVPLAYMRGRTFKNAWVILDEAQNTTPAQMKMFLTRIGEGAKCIVNGDPTQSDIEGPNGLIDAVARLKRLARVRIVEFDQSDVVRSGLVQEIIEAYATKPLSGDDRFKLRL